MRRNKTFVRYHVRQWIKDKGWCDGCGVFRTKRAAVREARRLKRVYQIKRFAVVRVETGPMEEVKLEVDV